MNKKMIKTTIFKTILKLIFIQNLNYEEKN